MRYLSYFAVLLLGMFLRDLIDLRSPSPATETKPARLLRPISAITEIPRPDRPSDSLIWGTGCEFEREQISALLDELEWTQRFIYRPDSLYRSSSPFVVAAHRPRRAREGKVQW